MAAPTTMHSHSRTFIHTFHPMGLNVSVCYCTYITSYISSNEIGRYLTYLNYLPQRKSAARGMIVGPRRLSGSLYVFLSDVIYTHALLTYCEASRKACSLSELRSLTSVTLLKLLLDHRFLPGTSGMAHRSGSPWNSQLQ